MTTRISVTGISPFRAAVKEDSTIIMNTTPLAPSSAVWGKKIKFTRPVTSAVSAIIHTMVPLPYFSSRPGPTSSRSSILPM